MTDNDARVGEEGLQVGDEGFFVRNHGGRDPITATVVKVGRKWAYIEPKYLTAERVDRFDGTADGRGYSSPGRFYTPEAMAHRERMIEVGRVIEESGLSFRLGARWAEADAIALADFLTTHFGRSES